MVAGKSFRYLQFADQNSASHHRMNAVRIRKENQVISAEEKRALMMYNQEQKLKREAQIISEFRQMLGDKGQAKAE